MPSLTRASTLARRSAARISPRRIAFAALLAATPLLPQMQSSRFEFPAIEHGWVCLPLGGLILLALIDLRAWRRWIHFDLVAFVALSAALACWRQWLTWPTLLLYALLGYLLARMVAIARRRRPPASARRPVRAMLPRSWLVLAILVLSAVHVSWAIEGSAQVDVAHGGVAGAQSIAHGRALYSSPAHESQQDPHLDTYGPVNYEAYLPFVGVAGGYRAARLTTVFFDLLTALLLFLLGRRLTSATAGATLAFCWLAFPFTLYCDALALNDSILAAALAGTLLLAGSPARRGALAALAAWTKFSPLALVPLLASYRPDERSRGRLLPFALAFALITALAFAPALAHSDLATIVSRTFGFQAHRAPSSLTVWSVLQQQLPGIAPASRVIHGMLAACVLAAAIFVPRIPRRGDLVGLAAACAAILLAVELCLSYYAFSYVLWFAPPLLAALVLDAMPRRSPPAAASTEPTARRHRTAPRRRARTAAHATSATSAC
jgi:hypothetical protein